MSALGLGETNLILELRRLADRYGAREVAVAAADLYDDRNDLVAEITGESIWMVKMLVCTSRREVRSLFRYIDDLRQMCELHTIHAHRLMGYRVAVMVYGSPEFVRATADGLDQFNLADLTQAVFKIPKSAKQWQGPTALHDSIMDMTPKERRQE